MTQQTNFICPFCKENMSTTFSATPHKTIVISHYCDVNRFYFKHFIGDSFCFVEIQKVIKSGNINITMSFDEEFLKIFYYNNVTETIEDFNLNINVDINIRSYLNEENIVLLIKLLEKHIKLMSVA